jgi:hypothetical protein
MNNAIMKSKGISPLSTLDLDGNSQSTISDPHALTEMSTTGRGSKDADACEDIKNRISKDETSAVTKQKFLVLTVMILAAIAVCIVVHIMTKKSEQDIFQSTFEGAAEKMISSFREVLDKGGSISSLDVAYTVHSLDHNDPWPFVTLTSFPERSASAKVLSGALFVSTNPFVTDDDRLQFEQYAALNEKMWKYVPKHFDRLFVCYQYLCTKSHY